MTASFIMPAHAVNPQRLPFASALRSKGNNAPHEEALHLTFIVSPVNFPVRT